MMEKAKRVNITREEVEKLREYLIAKEALERAESNIKQIKEKYSVEGDRIELVYRNSLVARIQVVEVSKLMLPQELREELKKKYSIKEQQIRLTITLPSSSQKKE
jgi:hypothetical protein